MNTAEIQRLVGAQQVLKGHDPVCQNVALLTFGWEMDVASVAKSGYLYEFEVKVSRSDFLADRKKGERRGINKWDWYAMPMENGAPNYFSYVCPEDLIGLDEIPPYAGLFYAVDGALLEIRAPKRLHVFKHDTPAMTAKIARLYAQRQFLGCALMTYKNRLSWRRRRGRQG